jgi:hypothetical protein
MRRGTLVVVAVVLTGMGAADQVPAIARVFVTVAPTVDGFTDSDFKLRTDTAKDLQAALPAHGVKIVTSQSASNILLEVVDRHLEDARDAGAVAMPVGKSVAVVPTRGKIKVIRAVLRTEGVTREFRASGSGTWSTLAGLIAKDVSTWLTDNQAKLRLGVASEPSVNGGTPATSRPPQAHRCEDIAATIQNAPGARLADKIRAVNPGSFGQLDDQRLERVFLAGFPCLANQTESAVGQPQTDFVPPAGTSQTSEASDTSPWTVLIQNDPIANALARGASSPDEVVNRFIQVAPVTIVPCKTWLDLRQRKTDRSYADDMLTLWVRGFVDGARRAEASRNDLDGSTDDVVPRLTDYCKEHLDVGLGSAASAVFLHPKN